MASSNTKPSYIPTPFASQGQKNTIPVADQGNYLASWSLGFPPVTSEPLSEGGLPPTRLDVNGAFNVLSAFVYYLQVGGVFTFDPDLASYIGGYPNGMMLWYNDGTNVYPLISTKNNNTDNFISNPSYIGASWARPFPSLGLDNAWTGNNTFSGGVALGSSATTDTISTDTDHSTKVVNSQWFRNAITNLGVQNLTKYEDIASSVTIYTAPIDGFIRVKIGATYNWQLYINGDIFQEQSRNNSDSCTTTWVVIPVKQGDVLTRGGSTYHFDGGAMWYPY